MKKLCREDQEFLLGYIKTGIAESHFNALRYNSEEDYNKTAQLQRIYNIFSYDKNDFDIEGGRLKK